MNKKQRPSWDQYFIEIIDIIKTRSTCDRGSSGCVITRDKRIIASGYNGSPSGTVHCDQAGHEMHTVTLENGKESRHCIRTTHSEQNAIVQAAKLGVAIEGATLYCGMTPCYICAKMIVNSGIKRVVCTQDYHAGQRSKEIFEEAGIKYELLNHVISKYKDQ